MDHLIELLMTLIAKAPFPSETEREAAMDNLRGFAETVGAAEVVPPKAADQAPPAPPPVVDPGPVAEPVPAAEQAPPPVSPEVAQATNPFAPETDDLPGSP